MLSLKLQLLVRLVIVAKRSRPPNTNSFPSKLYCIAQNKWYEDIHYPRVSEVKIVRYVKGLFNQGMLTTITTYDNNTTIIRTSYSHGTLKMYTKALIVLYCKQKIDYQDVMTTAPHPSGETMKSYERSLKRLCSEGRQSENFVDPGIRSIQDGYDFNQLVQVADYYLRKEKNGRCCV